MKKSELTNLENIACLIYGDLVKIAHNAHTPRLDFSHCGPESR